MACYVDALVTGAGRRGTSCHLVADSIEELHAFAARLGMRHEWFQDIRTREEPRPHYLLTESRRERAVRLGAVQVTRKQMVGVWRRAEAVRRITEEREAMREGDDAPVDGRWTL